MVDTVQLISEYKKEENTNQLDIRIVKVSKKGKTEGVLFITQIMINVRGI